MRTNSSQNSGDRKKLGFLEITPNEHKLLTFLLNRYPASTQINVLTKHQLLSKLESMKTEVPMDEEPTPLISAFTNLTEALGRVTEEIQIIGELQRQKNKIEYSKLRTLDEAPNRGQFVRTCEQCFGSPLFTNVNDYEQHYVNVHHE